MLKQRFIFAICACLCAHGQTLVDLRTQTKDVDFSSAPYTKPAKAGTGLPASCGTGEIYFRYDAGPGSNLYLCTALNVWTQVSGSGGSGASPLTSKGDLWGFSTTNTRIPAGSNGQVLMVDSGQTSGLKWANSLPAASIDETAVINGTTLGVNTTIMASRTTVANGLDTTCTILSGSSSSYAGSAVGNPITAYASGMRLLVKLDVTTGGGAITLDCGAGAKPVFQNDGLSMPTAGQWAATDQVLVSYDGTLNNGAGGWRILSGASGSSGAATGQIAIMLDGTAGQAACGYLGYTGTITGATIAETTVPAVSSSAVVDLWIGAYQPTVSNTIIGSGSKPALSSATLAKASVNGWSTGFTAGQWICGHLDSVTAANTITVVLATARN